MGKYATALAVSSIIVVGLACIILVQQMTVTLPVNGSAAQPPKSTVVLLVGQSTDMFTVGDRVVNLIYSGRVGEGWSGYQAKFTVEVWYGLSHMTFDILPRYGEFYVYSQKMSVVEFDLYSATIEIFK